jgi:hypothetical protein
MEVTVLGYTGKIREGSSGFYVDFDNYAIPQEHWTTVGLIAQKYSLLRDNTDPDSDANWKPLFSRLKHVDFGIVYPSEHRFPEFKDTAGLLKFISLLNNGLKEPDPNFINLDYIV